MRRWAGVVLGAVVLVAALGLGLSHVGADGVDCGPMWRHQSEPGFTDGVDLNDCAGAISDQRTRVLVVATIGAGVVVLTWPGRRHATSSAETAARSARVRARP